MENEHRVSMVLSASSLPSAHDHSRILVRRLSTPYHGLPSIIDYDSTTGYITFGEKIEKPEDIVHPRRFKEPIMPLRDANPNTCRHDYCLTERRRLYGLAVSDKPLGLPWSSGLLLRFPGHLKYQYPIQKSYLPSKPRKKRKILSSLQKKRKEELDDIVNEMIYFYKIVMLAGCIIREATIKKYGPEKSASSVASEPAASVGGETKLSTASTKDTVNEPPQGEQHAEEHGEDENEHEEVEVDKEYEEAKGSEEQLMGEETRDEEK